MKEIIIDTLIDGIKLLPFLLITFLIIEWLEHKVNSKKIINKSGKFGPLVGGILGAFPQCGFSVSATNLYVTRIITIGTLIAVYLSTSDEMLPIMLSEGINFSTILKIILIKVVIGILIGFIIDLIFRKKEKIEINNLCEEEHCHCEKGILLSSIHHTLNVFIFIVIISFILNMVLTYLGEETLQNIFLKDSFFSPFISSLVGLIPNCAASVTITELYLNNVITFGSAMAGLLTGSGVGILVLFKYNKNIKENLLILSIIYIVGIVSGILLNLTGIVI